MKRYIIFILIGLFVCLEVNSQSLEWAKRYNGPKNSTDWPKAIAVDGSGNVYVTGGSQSSAGSWDYATIKYSPTGNEEWVRRYGFHTTGSARKADIAYAIAIDGAGNIYVTGESSYTNGSSNFATIKYNTNGNTMWTARSNYGRPYYDSIARAIALDFAGNVYVAGTNSYGKYGRYVTIKYDAKGKEKWIKVYHLSGATKCDVAAIAVDGGQNIYVTGYYEKNASGCDFVTLKYNTNGKLLWSKTYNGPGNSDEEAKGLKIRIPLFFHKKKPLVLKKKGGGKYLSKTDLKVRPFSTSSSPCLFVTGSSKNTNADSVFATIKYDLNGNKKWVRRYKGTSNVKGIVPVDLGVDRAGNVYVTGSPGCNGRYLTVKYKYNGDLQWVKLYSGDIPYNYAKAMAVDRSGNVYVTGQSQKAGGPSFDFVTLKYDTNGNEIWQHRYDGIANGYDSPHDIVVDKVGNIYVTGYSEGNGTKKDYLTIKYSFIQ